MIGVIAEGKDAVYTIYAEGGVILCTGGFDGDMEMVKKYAPYSTSTIPLGANAGDTGDAIEMCEEVGADLYFPGYTMPSWNMMSHLSSVGLSGIKTKERYVALTMEMERFMDESVTVEMEKSYMARANKKDQENKFYALFDSTMAPENSANFEKAMELGLAYKGETVEELARAAGVDAAQLQKTVDHWNEMAKAGRDADFGNENISELVAPYYLCDNPEGNTGSYGGPRINTKAEVQNKNGQSIPGLYAAGECATADFFYRDYICGGSSLAMGMSFGREAARNAAARAKAA